MDKKDFCGELLAGHRVRGDDGHLPRACGPWGSGQSWCRQIAAGLRTERVSVAVHRRGPDEPVAQQNFMTRFCASDRPYARKCPRQRPIWKGVAPAAP